MSEIEKLIDQIVEFGINPKVELNGKPYFLKKLLVRIYSEYLNVKSEFDETDYDEPDLTTKKFGTMSNQTFPILVFTEQS